MIDQRQINELTARLAKLETMLQNNDAYSPPGAVTLADMDLGPGVDFSVPDMTQFMNQSQQDVAWDPQFSSNQQTAIQDENYGFGPTDSTITDLLQRISDLETLVAGGSNDTNQSGALNAGAKVGDDGSNGTGEAASPVVSVLSESFSAYTLASGSYGTGINLPFGAGVYVVDPFSLFNIASSAMIAPRSGYVMYHVNINGYANPGPAVGSQLNASIIVSKNGTAHKSSILLSIGLASGGSRGDCAISGLIYLTRGDSLSVQFDCGASSFDFFSGTSFTAGLLATAT